MLHAVTGMVLVSKWSPPRIGPHLAEKHDLSACTASQFLARPYDQHCLACLSHESACT